MGRFEEYEDYYNKYRHLSDKIAVLYQCGTFHEVYGLDNEDEKVANPAEIAAVLNMKLTRTNTSILENSRSNPLMAGFNSVSLDTNVERLVNCGYTVVVVNQKGPGKLAKYREVAYIQSPATTVTMNAKRDPYLVSVYVNCEYNRETKKYYEYIGMSAMDVTTGQAYWYETNSRPDDPSLALDDLTRFFQAFNPVEILLNNNGKTSITEDTIKGWGFTVHRHNTDNISDQGSVSLLDLLSDIKPVVHVDTYEGKVRPSDLLKVSYQETYLGQFFQDSGQLSCLEYLGMTRSPMAVVSLIYMLNFCLNQNKQLLSNLLVPQSWGNHNYLKLDTSSVLQLAIIESYYEQNKRNSVYSLLNRHIKTPMGSRILRNWLLNCLTNPTIIQQRYQYIEQMIDNDLYLVVQSGLKGLRDLDRLHRKMSLLTLTPAEFYMLDQCYALIQQLFLELDRTTPTIESVTTIADYITPARLKLNEIIQAYSAIIDIQEAGKCTVTENMQGSIFKKGYSPEIDELNNQYQDLARLQTIIGQRLSDLISRNSDYCKFKQDNTTNGGTFISLTKTQFTKLKEAFDMSNGMSVKFAGEEHIITWSSMSVDTRNKTNVKIRLNILDKLHEKRDRTLVDLRAKCVTEYKNLLSALSRFNTDLNMISITTGSLDVYQGIAERSIKYQYTKPVIKPHIHDPSLSWISTKGLRHPIVENNCAYVPQNISLNDPDEAISGVVLYGVNQSGKSCTMKSLGIAVIMAQTGLYVPAQEFTFYPYKNIMTRILGNDNLDGGLSAYAVEMTELRSILKRSDGNTLVLGDELCHGTESASAVSLVAASVNHMAKFNTSFIFATHLHELSTMSEITELNNVALRHLTVDFNDDRIIYDRKMQPGSGQGLYGLEVAKHLKLPDSVIDQAYCIRNKYFRDNSNRPVQPKTSRYNADIVLTKCSITDCQTTAAHTHHIRYQSEADAHGMVCPGMHKNHPDNLVGLCELHHEEVHHGNTKGLQLIIFGYSTGRDKKLLYEYRKILKSMQ